MKKIFLLTIIWSICLTAVHSQTIMRPKTFKPGTPVEKSYPKDGIWFTSMAVPDAVFERMQGKSYPANAIIPREDLRYLEMLYVDPKGKVCAGEMVCSERVADHLLDIFRTLFEMRYPIERMVLIDDYDADDQKSMMANNTSCFNYRNIAGTSRLSNHSFGTAVDINPLYNPWVKKRADGSLAVDPEAGRPYADRSKNFPMKISAGDPLVKLFKQHGFEWGGDWTSIKDYQHFELSKKKSKRPKALKKGDRVAVLTPSRSADNACLTAWLDLLREKGLRPVTYTSTFTDSLHGTYTASPQQRAADFMAAVKDTTISAILCSRGGFGAVSLLPFLDWQAISENPKWLIGFSDISVLHAAMEKAGVMSMHGPMLSTTASSSQHESRMDSWNMMFDYLFADGDFPPAVVPVMTDSQRGTASGRLIGGNFMTINNLAQTSCDVLNFRGEDGVILFLEDVDEPIYAIDRLLQRLHQSGVFDRAKAIIFGNFSDMRTDINFPTTEDMILTRLSKWGYIKPDGTGKPIVLGFPAGHDALNIPLILGADITLSVNDSTATITYSK